MPNALAAALRGVLAAIEAARAAGCIEHLDCWNEAAEQWEAPIANAREILLLSGCPACRDKRLHTPDERQQFHPAAGSGHNDAMAQPKEGSDAVPTR